MNSKALKKDTLSLVSFYEAFLEVYRWQRKRRRQAVIVVPERDNPGSVATP